MINEALYHGASILHEMPQQEGDERSQVNNHEEWKASYTGDVSKLWYQDVPDRQGISKAVVSINKLIEFRASVGELDSLHCT